MALKKGKRKKKEDEEIVQFEYGSPDLREKRARDWDKKQKNKKTKFTQLIIYFSDNNFTFFIPISKYTILSFIKINSQRKLECVGIGQFLNVI